MLNDKEYSTSAHVDLINKADEWLDGHDARDQLFHFKEEVQEVVGFRSRENAIEEMGDMLFTALRYVNSRLVSVGQERVTVEDVLKTNVAKLERKKSVAKVPVGSTLHPKLEVGHDEEFFANRRGYPGSPNSRSLPSGVPQPTPFLYILEWLSANEGNSDE